MFVIAKVGAPLLVKRSVGIFVGTRTTPALRVRTRASFALGFLVKTVVIIHESELWGRERVWWPGGVLAVIHLIFQVGEQKLFQGPFVDGFFDHRIETTVNTAVIVHLRHVRCYGQDFKGRDLLILDQSPDLFAGVIPVHDGHVAV